MCCRLRNGGNRVHPQLWKTKDNCTPALQLPHATQEEASYALLVATFAFVQKNSCTTNVHEHLIILIKI